MKIKRKTLRNLTCILAIIVIAIVIGLFKDFPSEHSYKKVDSEVNNTTSIAKSYTVDTIPDYSGDDYIEINAGNPMFSEADIAKAYENGQLKTFIELSDIDDLGRVQSAIMLVGKDTLATKERESIGMIKPSGWVQGRYDDLIADKYLYNRCHLLGYQLSGLNAVSENLMTCTRQMNIGHMLDVENTIDDYVENGGYVLYRVTPVYEDDNLLAKGALMEAKSLDSDEISICDFVYNVQNGITIDYSTGENWRS